MLPTSAGPGFSESSSVQHTWQLGPSPSISKRIWAAGRLSQIEDHTTSAGRCDCKIRGNTSSSRSASHCRAGSRLGDVSASKTTWAGGGCALARFPRISTRRRVKAGCGVRGRSSAKPPKPATPPLLWSVWGQLLRQPARAYSAPWPPSRTCRCAWWANRVGAMLPWCIPKRYHHTMSTQIAVRLPDELVAYVDRAVAEGRVRSRAELVALLIERDARRQRAEEDLALLAAKGLVGDSDALAIARATSATPVAE